jgi:hypothetical protein
MMPLAKDLPTYFLVALTYNDMADRRSSEAIWWCGARLACLIGFPTLLLFLLLLLHHIYYHT